MKFIAITEQLLQSATVRNHELAVSVCGSVLDLYRHTQQFSPWLGYLCEVNEQWVGTCAFKGNPQQGRVEIAYFTFPEYERRGYASIMAAELLAIAKNSDPLLEIIAYTLPTHNISTHILQKLGFKYVTEVNREEDGLIWQWSTGRN